MTGKTFNLIWAMKMTSSQQLFTLLGLLSFYSINHARAEDDLTNPDLLLQVYPGEVVKGLENDQLNFSVQLSRTDLFPESGDSKVKLFFETNANYLSFDGDDVDDVIDDSGLKVYSLVFDLDSDSNKTLTFNSTLIGLYHVKFFKKCHGRRKYFPDTYV